MKHINELPKNTDEVQKKVNEMENAATLIDKFWPSDMAIECDLGKIIVLFKQPERYGSTLREIEISYKDAAFETLANSIDNGYDFSGIKFETPEAAKEQFEDIQSSYYAYEPKYLAEAKETMLALREVESYLKVILAGTHYESDTNLSRAVQNLIYMHSPETWKKSEIKEAYVKYPVDKILEKIEDFTNVPIKSESSKANLKIDFETNNYKSMGCSIRALAEYYGEAISKVEKVLEINTLSNKIAEFNTLNATTTAASKKSLKS